jgi:hypothetical protein
MSLAYHAEVMIAATDRLSRSSSSLQDVPGTNGETPSETNSADSNGSGNGSSEVPGLTVGQKLLLKLPDLGRNKPTSRSQRTSDKEDEESPSPPVAPKRATGPKPVAKPRYSEQPEANDLLPAEVPEDQVTADSDSEDEPAAPSPRPRRSAGSRTASKTARPSPTSVYDDMPTSELTVLMRKLDDRERLFAFIAAPLGVVLAILVTAVAVHTNPALHHKGHESSGVIVADGGVGVAFALFVLAMAWFRRRSLTAFALLFLGYSVGLIGPGIPFLFLGGYLLFRAWKIQKVLTSRGVNTRPQRQRRTTERPARDPKARRDAQVTTTSARPTASKRYTPPKPAPKKPPVPKPEKAAGA